MFVKYEHFTGKFSTVLFLNIVCYLSLQPLAAVALFFCLTKRTKSQVIR